MQGPIISVMLAIADTPAAVEWYKHALGATLLWSLGPVAGLEIAGAPFSSGNRPTTVGKVPRSLGSHPHGSKCSAMTLTQ